MKETHQKELQDLQGSLHKKETEICELKVAVDAAKRSKDCNDVETQQKDKRIEELMEDNLQLQEYKEENLQLKDKLDSLNADNVDLIRIHAVTTVLDRVNKFTMELQEIRRDVKQYKEEQEMKMEQLRQSSDLAQLEVASSHKL